MKHFILVVFAAWSLVGCQFGSVTGETCRGGSYTPPACGRGQWPTSCVDSTAERHYDGECVGAPDEVDSGDAETLLDASSSSPRPDDAGSAPSTSDPPVADSATEAGTPH
jgi:hypothetical protein